MGLIERARGLNRTMNVNIRREGIASFNYDCIQISDIIKPESIGLIVTDPPYLIDYKTNHRKKDSILTEKIKNDANPAIIRQYFSRCYRILKEDTAMYCFCRMDGNDKNGIPDDLLHFFKRQIIKAGFNIKNTIIWVKDNWTAGDLEGQFGFQYECIIFAHKGRSKIRGKRWSDVWQFDRVTENEREHPNQKPFLLLGRIIESSSDPGDIIFDGFSGSGTTGISAVKLKRKAILCEISNDVWKIQKDFIDRKLTRDLFSDMNTKHKTPVPDFIQREIEDPLDELFGPRKL